MQWPLFFPLPRRGACLDILVIGSLLALIWYLVGSTQIDHRSAGQPSLAGTKSSSNDQRFCQHLPGANETVVVVKTSAAELEDRLPIHLSTTLLCYPNHLIFSDWTETYKSHRIRDALASVSRDVRSSHPDFDLWRRLRAGGPDALRDEEMWNPAETVRDLDKWKTLPMIRQTFAEHPRLKWYVFLQTDSFVFWSNLLAQLKELDSTASHYITSAKDDPKAVDTGSTFVLSHNSMKLLAGHIDAHKSALEALTGTLSSGNAVLSKTLDMVGVRPTVLSSMMADDSLGSLDFNKQVSDRRRWCAPAMVYHQVLAANIAELWKFEQEQLISQPGNTIRGQDVFQRFVKPRLVIRSGRVDDWDNYSSVNSLQSRASTTVDQCLQLCMRETNCVQFSFSNNTCQLSSTPRLGDYAAGVRSRWILPRLQRWVEEIEACTDPEYNFA